MSASVDFGIQGSCGISPLMTELCCNIYIYTYMYGLPRWLSGNPPANAEDAGHAGSIPGLGRSPGGGNGNPLRYFCVGNPMNRGACHNESDMATEHVCTHVCIYTMHSLKILLYFRLCWVLSLHAGFLCLWWVEATLVEVHALTAAASLVEHGSRALGLSSCARA